MAEIEVANLISVAEAIAVLDGTPVWPRVVRVALADAQGLCLAEDIVADRDYPPFDKSQMDGFALRLVDAGKELRVVGEIAAGQWPERAVGAGEAVAIMTGAPMPEGADSVAPVEVVKREGDRIWVEEGGARDRYISRVGSDIRAGEMVLGKGVRMEAAQIAAAASVGAAEVFVHGRPRVAVMATGDEIVDVNVTPKLGQIRNSNLPMMVALLRKMGCEVTSLGTIGDEPGKIRAAILEGLKFDALFVSGGMSMGEYDYVPGIFRELGVELKITKLKIKPGKPFVFGSVGKSVVFGLPGNPVSAFVCTVRLAARVLARLSGGAVADRWQCARLSVAVKAHGSREFYQPVRLEWSGSADAIPMVLPVNYRGSSDIFTIANSDGLLVRPADDSALTAGSLVRVLAI